VSSQVCFLITVLYGESTLKCALAFDRDTVPEGVIDYPMNPDSKPILHAMLPLHVRSAGPIIDVEEIFEVHVVERD
jgi:hypothetical protein